jgi:hypothetical protein
MGGEPIGCRSLLRAALKKDYAAQLVLLADELPAVSAFLKYVSRRVIGNSVFIIHKAKQLHRRAGPYRLHETSRPYENLAWCSKSRCPHYYMVDVQRSAVVRCVELARVAFEFDSGC